MTLCIYIQSVLPLSRGVGLESRPRTQYSPLLAEAFLTFSTLP